MLNFFQLLHVNQSQLSLTAMMRIDTEKKPILSGGPLGGEYEFAQLHYHWVIFIL